MATFSKNNFCVGGRKNRNAPSKFKNKKGLINL